MPFKRVDKVSSRKTVWQVKEEKAGHTIASRKGFYSFSRYRKIRNYVVELESFQCEACVIDGRQMPYPSEMLDVDHIVPIPTNFDMTFDDFLKYSEFNNLQVLCKKHHRMKTNQKGHFARKFEKLTVKKSKDYGLQG